jgi:hypothetical protein
MENVLLANPWFPLQAYIFRPKGRGITPTLLLKSKVYQNKIHQDWLSFPSNNEYHNANFFNIVKRRSRIFPTT